MTQNGCHPHHDLRQMQDSTSGRQYIGSISELRPLLKAFETFQRIELLDHAETLHLLSDLALHQKERLPVACTDNIVLNGVPEVGVFLDTSLLRNLVSGCKELLCMARHDRFGAFRGSLCDGWPSRHRQEPLLSDDEDRAVRRLAHKIISIVDNDAAPSEDQIGAVAGVCPDMLLPVLRSPVTWARSTKSAAVCRCPYGGRLCMEKRWVPQTVS